MCEGVQWPFNAVYSQTNIAALIDTYPAETHCFDALLELRIDGERLAELVMD